MSQQSPLENPFSKHAILNGTEVIATEVIRHRTDGDPIIVFEESGSRLYATADEWVEGAKAYAQRLQSQGIVASTSSASDKIALFCSLFKGREDLFAHGYKSKTGKVNYTPACFNEWRRSVCPKCQNSHAKCGKCASRAFSPLSDEDLKKHFKGAQDNFKDVIGLYVMDEQCRVSLLVADFDGEGWQQEVLAYKATAAIPHGTAPTKANCTVAITKRDMIHIQKEGLPPTLQARIRRLAAFANPEFYRAQAMGQSVYGKARIIDQSEEYDDEIMIPRGCEQRLFTLLKEQNAPFRLVDDRFTGKPIAVDFKGKLRASQESAAKALLEHECGILSAPTGFGKTVIGAYLISRLKLRTLVIVPSSPLLSQWKERLESFLDVHEELPPLLTKTGRIRKRQRPLVGQVGGGKKKPSGIIDIAIFNSLLEKDPLTGETRASDLVKNYGLIICDECQHAAAPQLVQALKAAPARYVYGLSATPKRSDRLEGILFMHCGPIVHKVSPKAQAEEQSFDRLLEPRFTNIRLPKLEPGSSFNQVLEAVLAHDARNSMIIKDAVNASKSGRTPLVLTKRKDHATLLAKGISSSGCKTILLTGEGTAKERRQRLAELSSVPESEHFTIVATGSYVGEGFDEPRLDTLILAAPVSWEGVLTQYSGRLHRENAGKHDVVVFDYVDATVPMLDRMYKKRLKTYANLGYQVKTHGEDPRNTSEILGQATYASIFNQDIEAAAISIMMQVPYANKQRVNLLLPSLSAAVHRGIPVTIQVKRPRTETRLPAAEETLNLLQSVGCQASFSDEVSSALTIFDKTTVWYGSLPLLAFPKEDDCSLRFSSAEIAHDLLTAHFQENK